ncbi:hypothetical protein E2553_35285 [Paraburkholderia dipogonis]|uniref:Phage-related membrane protein n=1 Tax=Paraburkholderia dipogonis TaxID=1211383 RepID=A0A4Y8MX58_9BURK|nr:hypothetical protein [Paraburkholderia dipogonis]TFE41903.1 hypothetical protein E2553_35285 [Paraburkholderia dipogonis]
MNDQNFEPLLTLYRASEFKRGREASLKVKDQAIHDALVTCVNDAREFSVTLITGDPDNIPLDSTVELSFGDPRSGRGVLAENLADLLLSPTFRVREPRNYFLIDGKFATNDTAVPKNVKLYRQVLELVATLKKAAAYLDVESGTLVFVHGGKFELPANYNATTLGLVNEDALKKLVDFVGNDTHSEQKVAILETAVRGMLEHVESSVRFERLLTQLADLATKANDGYRLFVASFSYDKVRDTLEATKVEYATKIHKAFSDIQTQILSIPVATVVVATQMKMATAIGYEFWLNSAVLVGCWVFAVLVTFVLWNQFHTLGALAGEIKRQRETLTREYKDIAQNFEEVFKFLNRRLSLQYWALSAVGLVLAVGFVLAHVVYFKLTYPAWVAETPTTTVGAPASGASAAPAAAPPSGAAPASSGASMSSLGASSATAPESSSPASAAGVPSSANGTSASARGAVAASASKASSTASP